MYQSSVLNYRSYTKWGKHALVSSLLFVTKNLHYMATCRGPSGLWIYIGRAFQKLFCNDTGSLAGLHLHKQPFQLCLAPYLQRNMQPKYML